MKTLLAAALCILLLLCSYYDIKRRIIPNILILQILFLGILGIILNIAPYYTVYGAIIPSLPLLLIRSGLKGIGAGDIKLLSSVGIWLGWQLNLVVFVFACLFALLYSLLQLHFFGNSIKTVPFAPFLSLTVILAYGLSLLL